MQKYNLSYIGNKTLRENVTHVFADVYGLLSVIQSQKDGKIRNCLRKTIIIYAASIAEALLLWQIEKEVGLGEVTLKDEWKQYDTKIIHQDKDFEVISAKRSREKRDIQKLDFNRMLTLCRQKKLMDETLLKDLDTLRKMRNTLHIGGVKVATKTYTQRNIEFALETVKKTIQSIQ